MTIPEPAPIRHQKVIDDGMANLEKYADSSLEGWQFVSEKNGVKLYSRKPEDPSQPMIYRGDYHYAKAPAHLSPIDATTPIIFASSRKTFDSRFDDSEIRVIRSRYSSISYGKSKAVWPITPRDFSTVTLRSFDDETAYFGLFSAVDDEINPPVEGYVRGQLVCTGWKIYRDHTNGGLMIILINQTDLAGSVPPALAKSTLQQMPLLTAKLAQYHDKYGTPPNTTMVPATPVNYLGEDFDHISQTYTLHLGYSPEKDEKTDGAAADIKCCDLMYAKGFDVQVQGQAQYEVTKSTKKNSYSVVHVSHVVGSVTIQIVKSKNK
ncbi:hypothetical protein BCR42DRAFT_56295 [Absidia repens]|uniref:START domain-containing protein n=1 Tax=Absidia repens TaxID=90262 RepID=A0A1X2IDV7_9FUNG|nr:hypothetical protein BCR42DRAFT_56295 [Absidia repens]